MREEPQILQRADFGALFTALQSRGFTVVGPTVVDQAIVYEELDSIEDLPIGWTDEQDAGRYRLRRRDDEALFGYVVGPQSWKQFLHPPHVKLFGASRDREGALRFESSNEETPRFAFLGARSCELHGMAIQDRVFLGSGYVDSEYAGRRENSFTIAVNCGQAGGTCFCASMNTGPKVDAGTPHDLALTEILEEGSHYFVVTVGSEAGRELMSELPTVPASEAETRAADELIAKTAREMGRAMNPKGVKELLYRNLEHPRWEELAERCLTCANCTMVCPTCFCTTVEDVTDLTGENAERWRRWDSCFTIDFSYLHGGSVRQSAKSRYRQWLTHKFATWQDQFGSSGCVGCGRCITWCPVGIDVTEEIAAIREET